MLVLHAALAGERLLVWGERPRAHADATASGSGLPGSRAEVATSSSNAPGMRAETANAPITHPHAAGHAELVEVLDALGALDDAAVVSGEVAWAWLPVSGGAPLPSPGRFVEDGLAGDVDLGAPTEPPVLAPLRVPVLALDARTAGAVLSRCGTGDRPPVPGVAMAMSTRALARVLRHAAATALRQEVVPDLRRSPGRDDDGFVARWSALPRPASRDAVHALARALPAAATSLALVPSAEGQTISDPSDAFAADVRVSDTGAIDVTDTPPAVPPPVDVIAATDTFVDALVDALVRDGIDRARPQVASGTATLHDRWLAALGLATVRLDAPRDAVDGPGDLLDALADEVREWQSRLRIGATSPFRLVLRLEEPIDAGDDDVIDATTGDNGPDDTTSRHAHDDAVPPAPTSTWYLRYLVQSRADPSIVLELADAWSPAGANAKTLKRLGFDAGLHLLVPLGEAARLSEPIEQTLRERTPVGCELTTAEAHTFLTETTPLLEGAGIGTFVPSWWNGGRGSRAGINLRARVTTPFSGGRRSLSALNLETLVGYDWQLAIGADVLSKAELDELARQKSPLVRVRGRWVELADAELRAAVRHVARVAAAEVAPRRAALVDDGSGNGLTASIGELVGMSVGGGVGPGGLPVGGVDDDAGGGIDQLLRDVARHEVVLDETPPLGLVATLRPYQLRGMAWLDTMGALGLGALLADDMGLGKSVQALSAILRGVERRAAMGEPAVPSLVVAPTSTLTNWQRECERFTPGLPVLVHHGARRLRGDDIAGAAREHAIVVTSYALLARDIDDLASVQWSHAVLDEAQNIKNPNVAHAIAARALTARARVALTGTPVENSVGDLWSIMEFLNPGLLGLRTQFRRRYVLPIQTGAATNASERLRELIAPFLLRREKTDRTVIADLPDRFEHVAYASLTREQVTLYEAIVRDTERMLKGRAQAGIERRGLLLAAISRLKQACNHPAQLLGDGSPATPERSGKLALLEDIVERVLDRGERALVFTQFAAMGHLLQRALQDAFGREVAFLHGGTARSARDRMVERFQSAAEDAPPVLVLSLKAGGSGLNLTAATHVVHYDRWWNPATEQQATDRAFRIGQTRDVQVHALVCAGTIEERIDRMLREKRGMAGAVIGSGETWITELDDDDLLEVLRLRDDTLVTESRLDDTGVEWRGRGARLLG